MPLPAWPRRLAKLCCVDLLQILQHTSTFLSSYLLHLCLHLQCFARSRGVGFGIMIAAVVPEGGWVACTAVSAVLQELCSVVAYIRGQAMVPRQQGPVRTCIICMHPGVVGLG